MPRSKHADSASRPRSRLALRSAGIAVLAGVALGLVISVAQVGIDLSRQRVEIDQRMGELLEVMRGPALQSVFELDASLAHSVVRGLMAYRAVRRARVIDDAGEVMAADERGRPAARFDWLAVYLFGREPYRLELHHAIGGAALGSLEVDMDPGVIGSEFLSRSMLVLVGGLVRNLVLAALLALLFHRLLTRPLLAVVRGLAGRQVEVGAPRLARPRGHHEDELGLLVDTINALMGRVDAAFDQRRRVERALSASEAQLRAIIDNGPAEVHLKDTEGRYLMVNRRFAELYGCTEEQVRGRRPSDLVELIGPDLARFAEAHDAEVLACGETVEREETSIIDGRPRTALMVKFPVRDARGTLIGTGGLGFDISERERVEQALRDSEQRFRDLADATSDWIWETDARLRLVYVSERLAVLTGEPLDRFIGSPVGAVLGDSVDGRAGSTLAAHRAFRDLRFHSRADQGESRYWSLSAKPIIGSDGEFAGYRGTGTDITRDHQLASELAYQASHDGLTGLINRHTFERRLERVIETVREGGGEHAVCYLDLDQFKVINDTCGHVAGDELLRQLGRVLGERVRKRDTLARLGGDEFGVLLERCSADQARRVAEEIRRAVQDFRFTWGESTFRVGVSIGLVPVVESSGSAVDILARADSACYAAKDDGRNRIREYRDDDALLARRSGEMRWVARINRALEADEFELFFQEIVPLGTTTDGAGGGRHFELLLRLRRDDGELAPPGAFLPAAERYGLAARLDRWVVEHALAWLQQDPQRLAAIAHCAINLSGRSLGDEEFMRYVLGVLAAGTVPADKICFEVTETAAISNLANATRLIHALREVGCRFALDDFGSGLSSFAYLKNLAVDFLKIDGAFVRNMLADRTDRAMVRSINDLGHVMGKRTIAEFVEDEALASALAEMGVDYAQGYGIARPRPLAEFD